MGYIRFISICGFHRLTIKEHVFFFFWQNHEFKLNIHEDYRYPQLEKICILTFKQPKIISQYKDFTF